MENIACARQESSLSKTGSPIPTGSPSTRHSIIPPAESEFSSILSRYSEACLANSLLGIYNLFSLISL